MTLTVGSFCAGIGGLDIAVESYFDAELAWYFEHDPAPSQVMARHWPGIPNHGDLTDHDFHDPPEGRHHHGGLPVPAVLPRRQPERHRR